MDWTLSLVGGVFVGMAAIVLLLFNGRILGVSGIVGGLFYSSPGDRHWRISFLLGVLVSGLALSPLFPKLFLSSSTVSSSVLMLAGILVGFGTRLGSGCTSGHGVCGVARFSIRSIVATACFMASGIVTVYFLRHVLGWNQ
jgi:uncharacterized protein